MPFHHYAWATKWSVGRLLEPRFPMPNIPPSALERGSLVHSITEAIDTGGLVPGVPPELEGYVQAWKKFTYAMAPSWGVNGDSGVEYAFDNSEYGFHGIIDRLGSCGAQGLKTILDIKTGRVPGPDNGPSRVSVQLALYALGVYPRSATAIQRIAVACAKDGTYKVTRFTSPDDFIVAKELIGRKNGKL